MHIAITYTLSQAYYQECFNEWLAARSKRRKWQPLSGGLLLVIGAVLWASKTGSESAWGALPVMMAVLGALQLGDFYWTKRQWLRARMTGALLNQTVSLTFTDEGITHNGPFSSGKLSWPGIQSVQPSPNGLFLVPQNGVSIYLPTRLFGSATQVQEIVQRVQGQTPRQSI